MPWSIENARQLYRVPHWSEGYFDINECGHVIARPNRDPNVAGIDLYAVAEEARKAGLSLPLLVRFTDILGDRIDSLCGAFQNAVKALDYPGAYTAVYPLKVNQQKHVVTALLRHGAGRVGLEAGSKSELMAVLALSPGGGVIICNGYKDRDYIRLALLGMRLDHRLTIVIEKLSELETIIEEARAAGIVPRLGIRVRLASIGAGNWQNTGGEKSKFGLSTNDVLSVVERLQAAGMQASLDLLHFHLGSQIARLDDFRRAMQEAARYFASLQALGIDIRTVDVGGGLGVDYEGTRSESFFSMNYSVRDYARTVVEEISAVCRETGLTPPDLVTESGRAMTAHHAVLITNVIDVEHAPGDEPGKADSLTEQQPGTPSVRHQAARARYQQALDDFTAGRLTLAQRRDAENDYHALCQELRKKLLASPGTDSTLLENLHARLADKYFCNFSVFQSVPDAWGIDQIFPVVPLHRLDEPPGKHAILQDLTCDSDGHIDAYVTTEGTSATLPVHAWRPGESYLLGIFLVGAYQEILGDMHNLFGDTDSVNVEQTPAGGYRLTQPEHGDTVDELLRYVHLAPEELLAAFRGKIARIDMEEAERNDCLHRYEVGLSGYTYHESDE